MEGLPVIIYEPYKVSWNEEERVYFFNCSEVREFTPDNYLLFCNMEEGIKTTFELRDIGAEGWIYHAIGESGIKKPCRILAIKNA